MGGHAQGLGASGPFVLDAALASGHSEVPGGIVASGVHRDCLIELVGSKKCMHILSSCPLAFKACVLLANSI